MDDGTEVKAEYGLFDGIQPSWPTLSPSWGWSRSAGSVQPCRRRCNKSTA